MHDILPDFMPEQLLAGQQRRQLHFLRPQLPNLLLHYSLRCLSARTLPQDQLHLRSLSFHLRLLHQQLLPDLSTVRNGV